jgi:hypothetical protein
MHKEPNVHLLRVRQVSSDGVGIQNAAPQASFVDPSVIPSLATNASIVTTADHSTSLISGDLSLVDPSAIPSFITISTAMGSEELNNPVASTTQMLIDISAAPSTNNVPTDAVIAEKGPTGMTKKAGIMRPNSHSKTARRVRNHLFY